MTLEIIVFISAILFGILWYWRESRSNRTFRILNKITHAKHLQMKPDDSKGFLHQQNFLLRLVYLPRPHCCARRQTYLTVRCAYPLCRLSHDGL